MTRYGIDDSTALRLIREGRTVGEVHQLVAPARLRSDVLAALYADTRAGRIAEKVGKLQLEALAAMKIRLLGDRVSRATAWRIADSLDWDGIAKAEYLAVASLQADLLVTDDAELIAASSGIVPVATFDDLVSSSRSQGVSPEAAPSA
ncbi:hypothetical protein ACWPKO_29500 (plasmid) [Coraliomargarita sp. W4R53]